MFDLRLVSSSPEVVPSFLVTETNGTNPEKQVCSWPFECFEYILDNCKNVVFLLMDLNLLLVKALDVLDRRAVFPTTLRIMLMLDFDAILMSKEFSIDKLHLFYFVM